MSHSSDNNHNHNTTFDPSSFVTVLRGELPLVLSAPHGGTMKPQYIPDTSPATHTNRKSDLYTAELAQQLADCIAGYCGGKRPFLVINKLHRIKMDANRDITIGVESTYAKAVYEWYHAQLQSCCEEARMYAKHTTSSSSSQITLLLDIHGYGSPESLNLQLETCWVMLGHMVSSSALKRCSDEELGMDSSWIRGPRSLGSLLERQSLLAEPSSRQPFPSHPKYFSGGYITKHYRQHEKVKTIQLEFPRQMRTNLEYVVPRVGQAVVDFLQLWYIYS